MIRSFLLCQRAGRQKGRSIKECCCSWLTYGQGETVSAGNKGHIFVLNLRYAPWACPLSLFDNYGISIHLQHGPPFRTVGHDSLQHRKAKACGFLPFPWPWGRFCRKIFCRLSFHCQGQRFFLFHGKQGVCMKWVRQRLSPAMEGGVIFQNRPILRIGKHLHRGRFRLLFRKKFSRRTDAVNAPKRKGSHRRSGQRKNPSAFHRHRDSSFRNKQSNLRVVNALRSQGPKN